MSKAIIVIGAGGHAKVVVEALSRAGKTIMGAVDPDPAKAGQEILGIPVMGGDDILSEHASGDVHLANGVGLIEPRRTLFVHFKKRHYTFENVIHLGAVVPHSADLGEGSQIMAGVVVQPDARIGRNALINTRASVDHDCDIGAHAHIAPGATLAGGVRVGEGTLVGSGATIIENVTIGRNCVIGAGAVVVEDVADDITVFGVPARPVSS